LEFEKWKVQRQKLKGKEKINAEAAEKTENIESPEAGARRSQRRKRLPAGS
jgi:hypothetical protein